MEHKPRNTVLARLVVRKTNGIGGDGVDPVLLASNFQPRLKCCENTKIIVLSDFGYGFQGSNPIGDGLHFTLRKHAYANM